ncbi:MAG: hypothetical protein ACOYNL_08005 [Rickettsiales bacterium]
MTETASQVETIVTPKRGLFGRAWHGEEKLWKVFWIYGVLIGTVLSVVVAILLVPVLLASLVMPVFQLVPLAVTLPYWVWNMVSCWRCAWNAKLKIWGYIVRILVVLGAVSIAASVVQTLTGPVIAERERDPASDITTTTEPDGTKVEVEKKMDGTIITTTTKPTGGVDVRYEGRNLFEGAMPSQVPAAAPLPATVPAAAVDACEKSMRDYAAQNNADANAYVQQNQAYLVECRKTIPVTSNPTVTP